MNQPVRLQLSRKPGFRLQLLSIKANGLIAVSVARPSRYGNPFVIGRDGTREECLAKFESHVRNHYTADDRRTLERRNLACWCGHGERCHADVLLKFARGDL